MLSKNSKIVYITCCENGFFGLKKLVEIGHMNNIAVLTINPEVANAAQVSGYIDIRPYCKNLGMNVRSMKSYKVGEKDLFWLKSICPDIILVNGWNRLLPIDVLESARLGAFGVHAGHPPRGRGRAPIAWSLINGLRDIEVYLFRMKPEADNGDVVATQRIEITLWDDARTLYDKVMLAISHIYLEVIDDLLSGKLHGKPQSEIGATYNPIRRPEDGLIDWSLPVERLHDFIRGQSEPYPGAFTFFGGQKLFVLSGHPFDKILDMGIMRQPGEVLEILSCGVIVATGTTPYLIRKSKFLLPNCENSHVKNLCITKYSCFSDK